jgi:hypothetical protein
LAGNYAQEAKGRWECSVQLQPKEGKKKRRMEVMYGSYRHRIAYPAMAVDQRERVS